MLKDVKMIAISTQDISLAFGTDVVLDSVSFSANDGDRIGIIGVNGAGKTTLLRILAGITEPDSGAVYLQKGYTVGMLEQNPKLTGLPADISCIEYMYTAFPELIKMEGDISTLEDELKRAGESDHGAIATLTDRLTALTARFQREGGLEFRSRCKGMLLRLGFDEEMIYRSLGTLSGGQYTRLALARLLATEPDVLILDEPTNHLDIDAVVWLESYLASYKKTVLIVSHDRYFLDKTTNKTLHLLYTKARLYNGSYTVARARQEAEAESLEKQYKEQQKQIAKIRANIEFQRRCNREHNFVTIRSKEKQLARMEKVELAPPSPRTIRMAFQAEEGSAGDVMEVKDLGFSYGGTPLFKNLSFLIRRYERVILLGPNGCGKSTLMKLMNSLISPTHGKIVLGYNIKIGYYDQENRGLHEANTVFSEMRSEYPDKTDLELRSTLALFLFGAEEMDKPVSALSGGERARLTLAKLILKKVNLLIMDEPTNHLDIGSREALESALGAFEGTVIAVSHDRYFINSVATRIIELDGSCERGVFDVTLEEEDDAFAEYLRHKEKKRETASVKEIKQPTDAKLDYEQKKRENAKRRGEEKRIERAHAQIEKLEKELVALDEELFGEAATDYVRAAEIDKRKGEIEEELLELYEIVM